VYTALDAAVALAEMVRGLAPRAELKRPDDVQAVLKRLEAYFGNRRLTTYNARLQTVADLRDLSGLGIHEEEFFADHYWDDQSNGPHLSQQIGRLMRAEGYEGVLWPSATKLGTNLCLFPDNFMPGSFLVPQRSWDPPLVPSTW
jgi:hypothetical protein